MALAAALLASVPVLAAAVGAKTYGSGMHGAASAAANRHVTNRLCIRLFTQVWAAQR